MTKAIPNLLTLLNLFCGCVAIVLVFNGAYTHAAIMIYIAAVFDFLDGTAARLLDARSEIGKQLDSLSDVVSFGVAPACMMYALLANASVFGSHKFISLTAMPAFLIALFSALRLAKFNIDTSQTYSFRGLPTPANALFIGSLPFILLRTSFGNRLYEIMGQWLGNYYVLLGLSLLLCVLLVANIPLMGLKTKSVKWKDNQFKVIFLILTLVLILWLGFAASLLIMLAYFGLSALENYSTRSGQGSSMHSFPRK